MSKWPELSKLPTNPRGKRQNYQNCQSLKLLTLIVCSNAWCGKSKWMLKAFDSLNVWNETRYRTKLLIRLWNHISFCLAAGDFCDINCGGYLPNTTMRSYFSMQKYFKCKGFDIIRKNNILTLQSISFPISYGPYNVDYEM